MVDITEVSKNIYLIDNRLYGIPHWGSTYFINEEKKALIDVGPTSSSEIVLQGIKQVGVKPDDIDYLVLTHIHLDHAGGVGHLARLMPRAQVLVHEKGARHVANPERLLSSARQVRGDKEVSKLGEVVPVNMERISQLLGGEVLKLSGNQSLEMIDAPGHAAHELCFYERQSNGIFTGDAAGFFVPELEIVLPSTPPPNFDLPECLDTFEKLLKLNASKIYFAHFGVSDKAQLMLKALINKLKEWDNIIMKAIKESRFDSVVDELKEIRRAELEPTKNQGELYKYMIDTGVDMSVDGFLRYYREKYSLKTGKTEEQ